MPPFEFTYQQDIPRIVTNTGATSIAYDQPDLYVSTDYTVEKNSDRVYSHPRPILSIVVYESMLYVCDGTSDITRYQLLTAQKWKSYRITVSSPRMLKLHQSKLYILVQSDTQDHLIRIDLHTQVQEILPLDPARIHRSIAFYQDTRYFLTVQRDTLEGRLWSGVDVLTGLEDSPDMVLVYPYVFFSGNSIRQYHLVTKQIVSVYETTNIFRAFNRYTSLAYGGNVIYLANVTRNQVESILSPPVLFTEIRIDSIFPSTGTTHTKVTLSGENVDQIETITLDKQKATLYPSSSSTIVFEVPEGIGKPDLRFYGRAQIPHSLTFTYENPRIYRCFPSECFEGQSIYLYGEYLDRVQHVLIQKENTPFTLLKNKTLQLQTPPGSGVASIVLIDQLSNVIYPSITFSYLRLESIICFPAGTLVHADQGAIEIQKLIPGKHTVYGKEIRMITDTYCIDSQLVCIEKDAFSEGYPYQRTCISNHHKILCRGKMIEAKEFVGRMKGVSFVPYDGNKLYNVLLYEVGRMNVQGMICETLDPSNPILSQFKRKLTDVASE